MMANFDRGLTDTHTRTQLTHIHTYVNPKILKWSLLRAQAAQDGHVHDLN